MAHIGIRVGGLVGMVALLLAVFSSAAGATTVRQQRLLVRYQPVAVMDTLETFAPTAIASFVSDANLETQTAPNVWAVVTTSPHPTQLPTTPTAVCVQEALVPCYRLNQRDCSPAVGVASLPCYQADWLRPRPRSVVYGRATRAGSATVLQYWYFYYDDFYSYNYPPDDLFWQTHEGDWEAVTMLIPAGRSHPSWVGYSQHCTGERRRWPDVPRWKDSRHPLVDVAIGSHANYFSSGTHQIAVQCIPPQAIQILRQDGLPLPVDYSNPGTAYGPERAGVVESTIIPVTGRQREWMRFIGTWGEYQYFHAPSPVNTIVAGLSPPSPPQSDTWQHPAKALFSYTPTQ